MALPDAYVPSLPPALRFPCTGRAFPYHARPLFPLTRSSHCVACAPLSCPSPCPALLPSHSPGHPPPPDHILRLPPAARVLSLALGGGPHRGGVESPDQGGAMERDQRPPVSSF